MLNFLDRLDGVKGFTVRVVGHLTYIIVVLKVKRRRYSCKNCGLNFSDFTGTIFAGRRLPLGEMFYILAHMDKESVKSLSEELGRSRSHMHRLIKAFRRNITGNTSNPILTGEIEIDEMYKPRRF